MSSKPSKSSLDEGRAPLPLAGVSTLTGLLRRRALRDPARTGYTFLADGEEAGDSLTYGELDARARAVAALLQESKAGGGRVLLLYPSGLEYVAAFFGCLYAGATAVPAYPPKLNRHLPRVQAIAADARAEFALTTRSVLARMGRLFEQSPELRRLRWLTTDGLDASRADEWREPATEGGDLAFLQYTSGSTSTAKGVMVTHENLLRNERMIQLAFGQTGESVTVGWLPLYHDMGLIGNVLQPLYTGTPCVLMSPTSFLQSPARWLRAVTRYRATTSGGPNFAYELCAERVGEEERRLLDLSSWEVAYNGSEPVRADTLEKFARAFAPCGFRREAFLPCYGLAEATLLVSGKTRTTGPLLKTFDADSLERHQAIESADGGGEGRRLVGCGEPASGQRVLIADPDTREACAPGRIGEVWVAGPNVARGYWHRAEESEEVFGARLAATGEGPFLRTGDLGFVHDGELFVTGRLKDLIIIRGLNHYPQDIEHTVERSHPALRPGACAAFSLEVGGEERLVVVQEVARRRRSDLPSVVEAIRQAVAEEHEVQLFGVALVKPGELPKTSSGKIRRRECRSRYLSNGFDALAEWRAPDAETRAQSPTPALAGRDAESVERWLQTRLAARLGVEVSRVDVTQPVARYGLDSLAAIELAHGLETQLGVRLSLSDFLSSPSIRELAAHATAPPPAPPKDIRVQTGEAATAYPLSQNQQSVWFMHQLAPESAAYNIARAARIRAPLDVRALGAALEKLTARHASLRTTFDSLRGAPVQWVHDSASPCFFAEDASGWDEARLAARLDEEAARAFDLVRGPLLKVGVFSRAPNEHVLLLVAHHIIVDFWSLAILLRELGQLYSAERAGAAADLAPPAREYTHYVSWQEDMLSSLEGGRLWRYWRGQLAGELPRLELHTDRRRAPVRTYRGAQFNFKLPSDLLRAVKSLARSHGATLYMTLLAAYEALLYRHTGQAELVVGSLTTGRGRAEFTGVVGYFVNTLALRARLSGEQPFGALLEEVRRSVLSAFEHQEYPFAQLVERLQPARDPSRSPIFQTMFVLQNAPPLDGQNLAPLAVRDGGARIAWAGHTLEPVELRQQTAQFDLTLTAAESEDGLSASFEYNTDLFDPSTVARMAAHFETLLRAAAADPQRRISELPLLPAAERALLLGGWNATAADYPADKCVHRLFEEQAARTPDSVAVVCGGARLTYAELNARANQLARLLRERGVGPEVLVALLVERSVEMVVGLLGVLKAGGAYVPLDPQYPQARLSFMLEDARVPVLLTQERLLGLLPSHADAGVFCLDADWPSVAGQSEANLADAAAAENSAYVIYTSGSTGRPKGVQIPHRALANFLHTMRARPGLSARDVLLGVTTLSFDIAGLEIYLPLLVGAPLVLASREAAGDGLQLLELIAAHGVTLMQATPSTWRLMLEAGWAAGGRLRVLCGGEALPRELADALLERAAELWNMYGPTETTIWSTVQRVDSSDGPVLIGCPVANTRAYVLDRHLSPAPVGVAGELYLGGDGLARGYLNRAGLTAERFVPDPHSGEAGARLYRTGDLARWQADGALECLGRVDEQVKVRGFRIELGEVEAALCEDPRVREAAVAARDGRLVAYVVGEREGGPSVEELRARLGARLPEYMVPSLFVQLERLPLTPNGKLDRKALPAPDASLLAAGRAHVAPRTPDEEALCEIWRGVLGVERVGVDDNFFELGGHSLLATQVMSRLREALRVELPLRAIFESPSVAALAERVSKARLEGGALESPPLTRVPRDGELPLSFAQMRLWLVSQFEPDTSVYNIPVALRFGGRLDPAALASSLRAIVARHEVLRTSFQVVAQEPVQVIQTEVEFDLHVADLRDLPEREREAEAMRLARAEARRPFDLTRAPLLRAVLARLGEDEHVFLLTMHHIVSDAWSLGVVVGELAALYEASTTGAPPSLAPLPVQYADFARWQRLLLAGATLEKQLDYWKRQLADAPPVLELPTDRPRPPVQSHAGKTHTFAIPGTVAASLADLSRRENATLYMTLLACFKVLLHRYTGQTEVVVGSPVAGRQRAEVEPLIGFFVNLLPLNTRLAGDMTFRELLARVRSSTLEAYAHQDVPFEKLVEELQPGRSLSHAPFFQVAFALQNTPRPELSLTGLTLSLLEVERATAKFDLTLTVDQSEDGLNASFEYSTDLFEESTVRRMASHFQTLLRGVAADAGARLSDLPLLEEDERQRLLVEFNDTRRDYPRDLCAHQLFEQQVRRAPDALALDGGDARLTYGELDARANLLAQHLRRLGVGPEVRVAILLERSAELVVSALATLKAGGAYVPLDPQYPSERLRFMLADSGAEVLLTDSSLHARLLADAPVRTLCLDTDCGRSAGEGDAGPRATVEPSNLAYVIYTSGSTGVPKGVSVTHRGLLNLVRWHVEAFAVSARDRATQLAGVSFDASVWEVWPYLASGASLHLPDEETRLTPKRLRDWLASRAVTITFLPTPLAEQVLALSWPAGVALRALLTGGDKLHRHPPDGLPFELVNNYGPTECSVVATSGAVPSGVPDGAPAPAIGRPIANARVYVLDARMEPSPVGVPGELYVGGEGLARGYHGSPALTAERFVPDPFAGEAGARLYRTGDVARYLADGRVEFVGRRDGQVKVRGFRVEVGEVEAALARHPRVREAAVSVAGEGARKRLVAYVVPSGGGSFAVGGGGGDSEGGEDVEGVGDDELRRFLSERLPEHMVPSSFVRLERLPLTPNGKLDRKALPEPPRSEPSAEFVEPRTAAERMIAGVWREVLGVERVGLRDNFFELGGHSLLATRVISHVRDIFRVELPLRSLFESPTVATLVETLRRVGGREFVEEIAQTYLEIEQLSEEEVRSELLGQSVAE